MDENMLLATGAANAHALYSAAGYFETLATADSLQFEQDYVDRFGADAPALSSPAAWTSGQCVTPRTRSATTARADESGCAPIISTNASTSHEPAGWSSM